MFLFLYEFSASFKEDFKLVDTWMLLKRNEEQPMQSMREMRQLLHSFKSSIQNHKNDIEGIVKVQCDPNREGASFDKAAVCIKTAKIKRVKNLLNDALQYTRYYNNLETTQFEELEDSMMKSWKKMSI